MSSRSFDRIRGAAALASLMALVGGVPLMLVRVVGRPWPQPFPPMDVVWRSLRSGDISDTTVLKALALVMWVAWARLAVSIVIEVVARVARVRVPRIVGLGRAQHWAAALVASAVLVVGVAPHPMSAAPWSPASAAPRPITSALLDLQHRPDVEFSPVVEAAWRGRDEAPLPSPLPSTELHVVQRHESFWSIAEGSLGDGSRWREIIAMNAGREVAPGVVFAGTPEHLLAGWQLLVPTGAVGAGSTQPTRGERTVVVAPGDTLTEIAARELGDAADWSTIWAANENRHFGNRVFDDPDLILPGWELIVPEVVLAAPAAEAAPSAPAVIAPLAALGSHDDGRVAEAPATTATTTPTVTAATTTATMTTTDTTTSTTADTTTSTTADTTTGGPASEEPESRPPLLAPGQWTGSGAPSLVGIGGAVMLAAGVAGAAEARRRRRLRAATVNARLASPTPRLVDLDRLIRKLDASERIARLDIALRAAGHALFTAAPGAVVLGVIDTEDGTIDVLLDRSLPEAPTPWTAVTGHRWRLPAAISVVDIAAAARRSQQPCPALIHVGSTPLDAAREGQLYLDLEALGVLAVDAPPLIASAIVRAVAAGLEVSPLAESAHLFTCGLGSDRLGHSLVEHPPTLAAALAAASRAVGGTRGLTAGLSTFVLRSRQSGGEAWEPAIVAIIGSSEEAPDVFDVEDGDLCAAAPAGQGIGVIVGRAVQGATWVLNQQDEHWVLQPLGLEVVPIGVRECELVVLQSLIDEADLIVVEPEDGGEPPHAEGTVASSAEVPAALDWSLMVRVLGPVEVVDEGHHAANFERSKAMELVIWMSQHREHSTRGGARTALWETNVRDATFANVVSDARRSLARLLPPAEGEEWIGRTLTEELPLHAGVVTDAEVLADCVRRAATAAPSDAIHILRGGLGLVRDMPFAGTAYLWPDAEGITSALILLVTSAATQLGGLYLLAGDVAGVFWATGKGLKVLPGHEELISLRMRAHGRQGDLAGVRHEWETYERVLDADTWSEGAAPSPKLVALRRQLLAPSLSHA